MGIVTLTCISYDDNKRYTLIESIMVKRKWNQKLCPAKNANAMLASA